MVAQAKGLPGGGQLKRIAGGIEEFGKTRDLRYFIVSKAALQSGKEELQKKSYALTNYENAIKMFKERHKAAVEKGDKEKAQRIMRQRMEYQKKNYRRVIDAEKEFREKQKTR